MSSLWPFSSRTDRVMDVNASQMAQAALKALQTQGRTAGSLRLLYRTLEIEPNNPQGLLILCELFMGRTKGAPPTGDDIFSGIIVEYAMDPKTCLPNGHKPAFEKERTVIMANWGFAKPRGTEVDLDHIGYMTYINTLMSQVGSLTRGFQTALAKLGIRAAVLDPGTGKPTPAYEEWLKSNNTAFR